MSLTMPLKINGQIENTLADAALFLGVSQRAVSSYIRDGIIPPPPIREYGRREVRVFPADYLDAAKQKLAHLRSMNRSGGLEIPPSSE